MPAFQYACFISYKHPPAGAPPTHFYNEFVNAFKNRLEQYLTSAERSYCDTTLRPGESYPPVLSERLCQSACLVAILTPEYPNSAWCTAEWEAMERLEKHRFGARKELIIPVVFRGDPRQWESHYQRHPVDLRVDAPREQLAAIKNRQKIDRIANRVDYLVSELKKQALSDISCRDFSVALGADKHHGPVVHTEPSPIGWS